MPDVTSIEFLEQFRVRLSFEDGVEKVVDLGPRLDGRLFGALRQDLTLFRRGRVDAEAGTIVWPNGADICPDVLYHDLEPV